MHILLTGYYGFGNFGDDLLMISGYSFLKRRYPDAYISIFANNTSNLKSFSCPSGYRNYIYKLCPDCIALVDWTFPSFYDVVVHAGGGTFFDYAQGSLLDAAWNRITYFLGAPTYSKLCQYFRELSNKNVNIRCKTRLGIGLGVGPYSTRSKRLHHEAEILGAFNYLSLRDPCSHTSCKQLGIPPKRLSLDTDLVFASSLWKPEFNLSDRKDKGRIGVVLAAGKESSLSLINIILSGVLGDIHDFVFIFLDEYHDANLIHQITNADLTCLVWQPSQGLVPFLEQFNQCSVMITNRAHGAIVAATLGIPSVILDSDLKLRSVHQMLPSSSLLYNSKDSIHSLKSSLAKIQRNLSSYQERVLAEAALNQLKAQAMVSSALSFLEDR